MGMRVLCKGLTQDRRSPQGMLWPPDSNPQCQHIDEQRGVVRTRPGVTDPGIGAADLVPVSLATGAPADWWPWLIRWALWWFPLAVPGDLSTKRPDSAPRTRTPRTGSGVPRLPTAHPRGGRELGQHVPRRTRSPMTTRNAMAPELPGAIAFLLTMGPYFY